MGVETKFLSINSREQRAEKETTADKRCEHIFRRWKQVKELAELNRLNTKPMKRMTLMRSKPIHFQNSRQAQELEVLVNEYSWGGK